MMIIKDFIIFIKEDLSNISLIESKMITGKLKLINLKNAVSWA